MLPCVPTAVTLALHETLEDDAKLAVALVAESGEIDVMESGLVPVQHWIESRLFAVVRLSEVRSIASEVVGPAAEAEALYVRQLRLADRMAAQSGEFVIWDIGLGAAANVITALRLTRAAGQSVRIISFDNTIEPLRFALQHADVLGYFAGYESVAAEFAAEGSVTFDDEGRAVGWQLQLGDFPSLMAMEAARAAADRLLPAPHAIMFDAFSPAKNPTMWTQPLFDHLFRVLDPARPCALATYSRSTLLRVSLLLAGFWVGVGHASGEKEETTVAANARDLIAEPLDLKWLDRARRSGSAEPLWEPVYRQLPLTPATWERLRNHPQFQ